MLLVSCDVSNKPMTENAESTEMDSVVCVASDSITEIAPVPDSISANDDDTEMSYPTDRPLTLRELSKLSPKQQNNYSYTKSFRIKQYYLANDEIRNAIVDYINGLDDDKKNGDITLVVGGGDNVEILFVKIVSAFLHKFDETKDQRFGYTILNNRIIYLHSLTSFPKWVQPTSGETLPFTLALNGNIGVCEEFFGIPIYGPNVVYYKRLRGLKDDDATEKSPRPADSISQVISAPVDSLFAPTDSL